MKLDKRIESLCSSEEDRILCARILDAIDCAQVRMSPKYFGFLDGRQQQVAHRVCEMMGFSSGYFWGGYLQAERVIFAALPEYLPLDQQAFPITALLFTYRAQDKLTHRDFLGCLMSQMIKREMIGDILVGQGQTTVFVHENIADMISFDIQKIGRVGVNVQICEGEAVVPEPEFKELSSTVASMRLDCILSFLVGMSREKCAKLIRSGLVSQNFEVTDSVSKEIHIGDRISVRGYGKFIIDAQDTVTKKGRLTIRARKYL